MIYIKTPNKSFQPTANAAAEFGVIHNNQLRSNYENIENKLNSGINSYAAIKQHICAIRNVKA
ncbi:hypothetical protein SPBRAN_2011 [uncultured Candidatus Thioglobus sp.]|nr:hypothetical protein SPBRAN_2011 [uncultured Candidatus Thioglobus sp.]